MAVYGSTLLYPALPAGGALPAITNPGFSLKAGEKNSLAGQYKAGDIILYQTTYNGYLDGNNGHGSIGTSTSISYTRLADSSSNGILALLVVPRNWFYDQRHINSFDDIVINATYNKLPYAYTFFLVRKNINSVSQTGSKYKINRDAVYYDNPSIHFNGYPIIGNVVDMRMSFNGSSSLYNTLTTLDSTIQPSGKYFYPPDVNLEIAAQLTTLNGIYDDLQTVFSINCTKLSVQSSGTFNPSMQLVSSLPIFGYTQLEELYKYIKFGDDYDPVNKDDLILSDIGLRTDWTIYVNGERRPDIYITMQSDGIDEYLASTDNKKGYKKSDFKIEYKIPKFKIVDWGTHADFTPQGVVDGDTDIYNNSKDTSWSALTDDNFTNKNAQLGNILDSPIAYQLYAQLQFRIFLNNNMFSAWCEFGIGYIGSPSVPDFVDMQNWGNVISIDDGSTVTIIYDKTPPDQDDYVTPDPDPDDDTPPSDLDLQSALTTTYKVTYNNLQNLGNYLWSATFIDDIHLINNSPIENIVSCKRLPIDIPATVARSITLGNITTPVNGNVVTNVPIIDVGTITYKGYYGNFLDYTPYTSIILFLPFCGFVPIDASVITDKQLNVKYSIDPILGKCKAMLYISDSYYMAVNGDIAIDIPLVASNRAQAEAGFAISGMEAAMRGDAVGALSAAVATKYHSSRNGSYTPMCAWQETRKCFMIVDVPTVQYPASYGHDVGYPCMLTRTLATLSGFTVCSPDVDLRGFSCTDREIDMIKEILTTGIYL